MKEIQDKKSDIFVVVLLILSNQKRFTSKVKFTGHHPKKSFSQIFLCLYARAFYQYLQVDILITFG